MSTATVASQIPEVNLSPEEAARAERRKVARARRAAGRHGMRMRRQRGGGYALTTRAHPSYNLVIVAENLPPQGVLTLCHQFDLLAQEIQMWATVEEVRP